MALIITQPEEIYYPSLSLSLALPPFPVVQPDFPPAADFVAGDNYFITLLHHMLQNLFSEKVQ
jgi:hypothetical protein